MKKGTDKMIKVMNQNRDTDYKELMELNLKLK